MNEKQQSHFIIPKELRHFNQNTLTILNENPLKGVAKERIQKCSCGVNLFEIYVNKKVKIIRKHYLSPLIMCKNPIVKCCKCKTWNNTSMLNTESKYWECRGFRCRNNFIYFDQKSNQQLSINIDDLMPINKDTCQEIICDFAIITACPVW